MDKMTTVYNDDFYRDRDKKTRKTAQVVLDIIVSKFHLRSAVDVGCGVGTWLDVFRELTGDVRVDGYDGDYVRRDWLQIDEISFHPTDLNQPLEIPDERYDLAISLEVAEHLKPKRAKGFVKDLCAMADVVLFSAALKYQGGDAHINEQRMSYWTNLFAQHGYNAYDAVRPIIWNDTSIPVWYRNNIIVYIRIGTDVPDGWEKLQWGGIQDVVHPDLYESKVRLLAKNTGLMETYQHWLSMYDRGDTVEAFFKEHHVRRIAIYGMADVGERLFRELKDSIDVEVCYGIDHYKTSHPEIVIYDYTDDLPEVDAIIVTPMHVYDEVAQILRKHGIIFPLYSIVDVLEY